MRVRLWLSSIASDDSLTGRFRQPRILACTRFRQISVARFSDVHFVVGATSLICRVFIGGNRAKFDLGEIARLFGGDHAKASDINTVLDGLCAPR